MKLDVLFLIFTTMASLACGAPLPTTTDTTVDTPTQQPTTPPPSLKKLSEDANRASLESWQSASILLGHIQNVILAGYEVPPSPTCFQEERDPITYEHPHPSTDFQANLINDYTSLLSYRDYFDDVSTSNSEQPSSATTRSPNEEDPIASPKAIYTIELKDFMSSLNTLLVNMEKLLTAQNSSSLSLESNTGSILPTECYEKCYGQQVSVLEDYLTLSYNYIPSDISGLSDSKKN